LGKDFSSSRKCFLVFVFPFAATTGFGARAAAGLQDISQEDYPRGSKQAYLLLITLNPPFLTRDSALVS